jgi:hypothetical protein
MSEQTMFTVRCNASPWYVPPGYLSTHWEGRTFHDDFFPFIGLLSGNYGDLAERMPNYRLLTLPVALRRGAGRGAYYGWEVTEDGEESAPYGHWTDEQFRHGQFSEEVWRFRIPQHLAATAPFAPGAAVSEPDALGLVAVACTLEERVTRLV